jgi:threonine dehydrogenase-like Zn-dependent dehydrogenase
MFYVSVDPEKCIDAVGMESHITSTLDGIYDRVKLALMLETNRLHVLREMIYVCRPGGTLSIPGGYGDLIEKAPFGTAMNNGLTFAWARRTLIVGQTILCAASNKAKSQRANRFRRWPAQVD